MLALLPQSSSIRVLRMSESRGLELPDAVLEHFPAIPERLEFLKWNTGEAETSEKEKVYRLERVGDGVKAAEWHQHINPEI